MSNDTWRQRLYLVLLGIGVFFSIAGLLALLAWITLGSWHSVLEEITLLAALAAMPIAIHLWERYVAPRL